MDPTLKKVLNIGSLVLAAFFVAPTVVILASWKALPGDALYSTKRNLENLALRFTAGNYSTNSSLQSELLARRADEAIVLALERSSIAGLDDLKTQAQILRAQVAAAPTQEKKQAAAKKAVAKLQESKTKLQATHVTLAHLPPTTDDIIDEITDTEEEIDDVIDDLIEVAPTGFSAPLASPDPSPQRGRGNNPSRNNSNNPWGGANPQNQTPNTATSSGDSD